MIIITHDKAKIFDGRSFMVSPKQEKGMDFIADAVVNQRNELVDLLNKYGVPAYEKISANELVVLLTDMLKKSPDFQREFAQMMAGKQYSNMTDGYTAATVGIMDSIASIVNAFQTPDNSAAIAATNAQIIALAAEKEKTNKRNTTLAIIGLGILALIAGFVIYKQTKK